MSEFTEQNRNLVKGWTLCVTMNPRTPLEWLSRRGEYKDGADHPVEEVPPEHAIWVVQPKSWAEMGIQLKEAPAGTMASVVGQIPQDGGDFLKFLIKYRRIVEDADSRIQQLKARYPDYAHAIEPKPKRRKPSP